MIGPTLRTALLVACLGTAPLAVAQVPEQPLQPTEETELLPVERRAVDDMHPVEMIVFPALGMVFVLGIVVVALLHDRRMQRDRLSAVERLVTAGHTVPRELFTGEKPPLPLPEERRRDIRRGITLLCWAIAVALIPIIGSGGEWRYGVWGLLFLLPSLGSFFKAWLTAREIERGASNGTPQR